MNQTLEVHCKKALDAIYGQAKRQGQQALEWFKNSRSDDSKLKLMLDAYRKATDAANVIAAGSKGKPKWSLVTYMEEIEAASQVAYTDEGEMMWEKQAIQFWMSIAGGAMTEDEAELRWKQFAASPEDFGLLSDQGGPPKKPLRLRVKVADKVDFSNLYARKRKLNMSEQSIKNATSEDIERLSKKAMANHDKVGDLSKDIGLSEIAHGMVAGGAGQAFNGFNMNLQDITSLLPPGEEEDDEEQEEAGEGDPKADELVGDKEGQKTRWFDKDRFVNAAIKTSSAIVKKTLGSHDKITEALSKAIEDTTRSMHDFALMCRIVVVSIHVFKSQFIVVTHVVQLCVFVCARCLPLLSCMSFHRRLRDNLWQCSTTSQAS
jgi:hypothetical protein